MGIEQQPGLSPKLTTDKRSSAQSFVQSFRNALDAAGCDRSFIESLDFARAKKVQSGYIIPGVSPVDGKPIHIQITATEAEAGAACQNVKLTGCAFFDERRLVIPHLTPLAVARERAHLRTLYDHNSAEAFLSQFSWRNFQYTSKPTSHTFLQEARVILEHELGHIVNRTGEFKEFRAEQEKLAKLGIVVPLSQDDTMKAIATAYGPAVLGSAVAERYGKFSQEAQEWGPFGAKLVAFVSELDLAAKKWISERPESKEAIEAVIAPLRLMSSKESSVEQLLFAVGFGSEAYMAEAQVAGRSRAVASKEFREFMEEYLRGKRAPGRAGDLLKEVSDKVDTLRIEAQKSLSN